jgi:NAD(P)H-dependent flavin oxidoreductase YrpB (nitropropane dioxygenase family)
MILAKEYLEQIKKDDDKIQNKIIELYQLRCIATGVGSISTSDKIQSSLEGDKLGKIVAKIADAEKELDEMIDKLVAEKQERIKIIEQVQEESNIQYKILHKRYVQFKSFNEIADEENYTTVWISKLHTEALEKVQNILNSLSHFNEL